MADFETQVAVWFGLNKIGTIISSSILLALNVGNSQQGATSPKAYLVLIALQCLGLPLALLISPVDKLIRKDGTKPKVPPRTTLLEGFRRFWHVLRRKEIAALVPIFLTNQWAQTYEGNYLTTYFSVQGRAVAGFIVTWIGLIANVIFGWFLDYTRVSRPTRAKVGWIVLFACYTATYIYNLVLEAEFGKSHPVYDIYTPGFARAVLPYLIYWIGYNAFAVWGYWILGCFDTGIENLTFASAVVRSSESLASTISYALGSSRNVTLLQNIVVAAAVFWASVPTTTWSTWQVKEPEKHADDSSEDEQTEETVKVVDKGGSSV